MKTTSRALLLSVLFSALITGCGGGGGSASAPPAPVVTPPPPSSGGGSSGGEEPVERGPLETDLELNQRLIAAAEMGVGATAAAVGTIATAAASASGAGLPVTGATMALGAAGATATIDGAARWKGAGLAEGRTEANPHLTALEQPTPQQGAGLRKPKP